MFAGDDSVLCAPASAIGEDRAGIAKLSFSFDNYESPDIGENNVAFMLDFAERKGCVVVDWLHSSTSSLVPHNGDHFSLIEEFGMAHLVRGVQFFIFRGTSLDLFSFNLLTSSSRKFTLRTGLGLCYVAVGIWLQTGGSRILGVVGGCVRANVVGALLSS